MPLYSLLDPLARIRGTLRGATTAGLTLWDAPHVAGVARTWTRPRKIRTAPQAFNRETLRQRLQAWKALDPTTAQAWDEAATAFVRTNPIGQAYSLTGANLFASVNFYRRQAGLDDTTSPPTALEAPAPLTASLGNFYPYTLQTTHAQNAPGWIFVTATDTWTRGAATPQPSDFAARIDYPWQALVEVSTATPYAYAFLAQAFDRTPGARHFVRLWPLSLDFVPTLAPITFDLTYP